MNPQDSQLQTFDVAVIGAGLGGTGAALALARRGARVVLLEAGTFPRHKVCGEFLSSESSALFQRLGVREAIVAAGARHIHAARIVAPQGVLETVLPAGALSLSRWRLDHILWDAAREAGAACLDKTRVHKVSGSLGEGFEIESSGASRRARCVIAAPGRNAHWLGRTATPAPTRRTRHFGFKAHFRGAHLASGVTELHAWNGGYCGIVRIEDDLTNVCLLARYDTMNKARRSPEAFWAHLLQTCPALAQRLGKAERVTPWLATANVSFGARRPLAGDVLCCGDAAGFIHPLTGDGMAMAARSGELAAAVAAAHLGGGLVAADVAPLYAAAWAREFKRRLSWAALLQPLLTAPFLTAPAIALLSRAPRLARLAVVNTRG